MRRLLPFLLLLPLAPAAQADTALRFHDDFDTPGSWAGQTTPAAAVRVDFGVLHIARSGDGNTTELTRPVQVTPATRWRASVDLNYRDLTEGDEQVRGGLAVNGALGDGLYVQLDAAGNVRMTWYDGADWVPDAPLPWTRAAAAKPGRDVVNRISLAREANGTFSVAVNGEKAGESRVIDFTPRAVGIALKSTFQLGADFDNLTLEETGSDAHVARLLGSGGRTLFADDFTRRWLQRDGWWTGEDAEKKVEVKDGRLLVTGKGATGDTWRRGKHRLLQRIDAPATPRGLASGYHVGARLTALEGDSSAPIGLVLAGDRGAQDPQAPGIAVQIDQQAFRLLRFYADGREDLLLPWTRSPSIAAGDNRLDLVVPEDGRLRVFINGDYQLTRPLPAGFALTTLGIEVTGARSVAIDDVVVRIP
ncbi:MAG: hypothetical protein K0S46_2417 [Moraxellaceae bacterium]|jgi:hypothetical protein|nr:hypothetical protein [Moraxellaceae bacterium]